MNKILLITLCVFFLSANGCAKKHEDHELHAGSYITNVHAPTSGSDSIRFTADTSTLSLLLFSPLGGMNHAIVHDITANTDLFNGMVSGTDQKVTGFVHGNNYYVICHSTGGTNFANAASSYRNSGQSPSPFCGYTQYYNSSDQQGPSNGIVVIIMEENQQSPKP